MEIANAGEKNELVTLTRNDHATKLSARLADDGTLILGGEAACGAADGYNFVAKVIHQAPRAIDAHSSWKVSLPVQFADCDTTTVPVAVSVERLGGEVLTLVGKGHKAGSMPYEGAPSYWGMTLQVHMIFINGRFKQLDATSDEDLDSVMGHSVWTLAANSR